MTSIASNDPALDHGLDLLVLGSGVAGLSAAVRAADETGPARRRAHEGRARPAATRWAQGGVAAVLRRRPATPPTSTSPTRSPPAPACATSTPCASSSTRDPARVTRAHRARRRRSTATRDGQLDARPRGRPLAAARRARRRRRHRGRDRAGARRRGAATAAAVLRALVRPRPHRRGRPLPRRRRPRRRRASRDEVRARTCCSPPAAPASCSPSPPTRSSRPATASPWRCGPASPCADVEFMQFHPTALHHPAMPRPLLSEALRGHGALLRDSKGERFVDELLPRDVVSPAMTARMIEQDVDHVWLDATGLEHFDERFPTIAAASRAAGLDPATRLAADRARRPLPLRRRRHRPRRRDVAARAVGRGRGRRAPACTAPTGWRRTRCSRAWCSAPGWSRPSTGASTAEPTGAMRR